MGRRIRIPRRIKKEASPIRPCSRGKRRDFEVLGKIAKPTSNVYLIFP